MSRIKFVNVFIGILLMPSALFAGIVISGTSGSGSFPLAANNTAATLVVDNNDDEVVKVVSQAFAGDINLLTGITPAIKTAPDNATPVIIGTLGKSALIDQLASGGKINQSRLSGKWETFCISVVDNPVSGVTKALVIVGSDPRGTAFGVFELSRLMGVSPWIWWADVTPEPREAIYVSGDEVFGPPSVKYRGMFINDEDWGLQPWAAKNMDKTINNGKGDIGPRTHEKIFEMMLRTKSNFLWPAMHPSTKAFWYYKENPEVARKYAIVLGSSHCEPMLRNNEDEWRRNFATEYPGVTQGEWNWKTNSTVVKNYWIDRVKEAVNNDAVYTLGMRGVHDSQMLGYNNDTERAEALKDIIATQRNMLETYLDKPKATVPQLFCPYKEALGPYNIGINLPVDVTLLWPDDNHGYIRQLSTPAEQARSGGGGVYYHFSYWGGPQDHLWLSSVSPVLTSFEMCKAYSLNAKDIWVFNVGDIKPAEFEYQFAMDLAWDVNAWQPEKAHEYARFWAEENFGSSLADEIADIRTQYHYLAASGKPEHVHVVAFSVAEMEQRLAAYAALAEKVKAVESQVPERLKAAYFQLLAYPVQGAAAMNEKILGGKLSYEYLNQGRAKDAAEIADRADKAYRIIRDLTYTYNKVIVSGKWDGIMDYAPRRHSFFYEPDVATAASVTDNGIPPATATDQITLIPAGDYSAKSGNVKIIEKLGVADASATVLPLDMTQYGNSTITSAPYAEYKVQLKKGSNKITVKCLPTFPLYPALDLRYAISVDGAAPQFISIKTSAEASDWSANVLRGYAKNDIFVQSASDKEASVKLYFADPGLVVSAIEITSFTEDTSTLDKLVNPDFEYGSNGVQLTGINRGDPYGWTRTGALKSNSWGTNQDAANFHGGNVCWYGSVPMPASFELSQTVKGLPAGEYIVRCLLGVPKDKLTTQRLFANKYVQYYGKESDYASNLTAGETNTFAGHAVDYGNGSYIMLKEMALKIIVFAGQDLKIGIRTSNKLSDGTSVTDDNSGWFKVDNFRLELVREMDAQALKTQLSDLIREAQELYNSTREGTVAGEYPQAARSTFQSAIQSAQTVEQNASATSTQVVAATENLQKAINAYKKSANTLTAYIVNPSFEYKAAGVLNDGSIVRGTPYGWSDTGGIIGNSFGINNDASNIDGNNVCWYLSTPMPADFELYQNIGGLPAGEYTVRCKLTVDNGKLATQRLFANNSVQYFGFEADYKANLNTSEQYSFAAWDPSALASFALQEMRVDVTIAEGETLKLGIRTSNKKSNGNASTNSSDGWFKVDNFRLELKELHNGSGLDLVEESLYKVTGEKGACRLIFDEPSAKAAVQVISLSGNVVYSAAAVGGEIRVLLPQGLYIVVVSLAGQQKAAKILVR